VAGAYGSQTKPLIVFEQKVERVEEPKEKRFVSKLEYADQIKVLAIEKLVREERIEVKSASILRWQDSLEVIPLRELLELVDIVDLTALPDIIDLVAVAQSCTNNLWKE